MNHLDPAMRRTLSLALEAYHAGSFPVGAVLTDTEGTLVAEGRNRIHESVAPPGRLCLTALAHAELDVIAQLPLGDYSTYVLSSSLEPCLLCRSAATISRIGVVRYLAHDPVCRGLHLLPSINEHAQRLHPVLEGPGQGTPARFAAVLPLAVLLESNRDPVTAAQYRKYSPDVTAAAERLIAQQLWPRPGDDLDYTLKEFTTDVWPE